MKKLKDIKIISIILSVLLFINSIILSYFIVKLNILLTIYLIIYILFIILLNISNLYINIFIKLKKKIRIISISSSIIFSILFIILSIYLNSTINFFNNINTNEKIDEYYIVILKNKNYKLNNLNNKYIGIYNIDNDSYDIAKDKLKDEINYKIKKYDNLEDMYNDIINKKIDSILLNKNIYEKLDNINSNYDNNLKVLDKINIVSKIDDITKDINVLEDSFNIYISGMDSYGNIKNTSKSDTNILVTINPKTKNILLTSIPRDYYLKVYNTSYKDKLTHISIYGIDTVINSLEELLETSINYYVKVNFTTLIDLIDIIDGITLYNDESFKLSIEPFYYYKKGYIKLDGKKALGFVRERKTIKGGDLKRGEHQQIVIKAIIDKVSNNPKIISKYNKILDSFNGKFITNMKVDDITSLIKNELDNQGNWNISFSNLSGYDSYNYTYTYKNKKLYVMEPDIDSLINTINKIDEVKKEK